jgi:hypothetical protein
LTASTQPLNVVRLRNVAEDTIEWGRAAYLAPAAIQALQFLCERLIPVIHFNEALAFLRRRYSIPALMIFEAAQSLLGGFSIYRTSDLWFEPNTAGLSTPAMAWRWQSKQFLFGHKEAFRRVKQYLETERHHVPSLTGLSIIVLFRRSNYLGNPENSSWQSTLLEQIAPLAHTNLAMRLATPRLLNYLASRHCVR